MVVSEDKWSFPTLLLEVPLPRLIYIYLNLSLCLNLCLGGWLGFFLLLLLSPEEGNGNPFQYSCLETPWTEEPGGLQSMGSKRVGQDWATDHINKATYYGWLVMSWMVSFNPQCSKAVVPNLFGTRDGFHGTQLLTSWCVAQFITGGWAPRL